MNHYILLIFLFIYSSAYSQRDYHWVFGDSAGIDFNSNPPSVDSTRIIQTLEPSASISDLNGNLLFYVGSSSAYQSFPGCYKYVVRCANDSIMPGGDSLSGHCSMTQGLVILPDPGDTNKYYIFHIQWAGNNLYYSVVDMSLNNGLGQVISVNNLLADTISEKMHAVKAGNGTYWWLITVANYPNSKFNLYKIDSVGISLISQQPVTIDASYAWAGQMVFSPDGEKLFFSGGIGPSLLYDFDRCAGVFSNPITLLNWVMPNKQRYGCSFSPSGRYAYLSTLDSLWQFDTQASNIAFSKQLIFSINSQPNLMYGMGQHMLGPDGKIYIAMSYSASNPNLNDSLTSHLTVINYPDSAGITCGIAPYSVSLNGRHSYLTLPNMPNYNLGPLENVNCDSILAVDESESNAFTVFPNPGKGKFSIQLLKRVESITIDVFTLLGNNIYTNRFYLSGISLELDLTSLPEGVYLMQITGESRVFGCRKIVVLK